MGWNEFDSYSSKFTRDFIVTEKSVNFGGSLATFQGLFLCGEPMDSKLRIFQVIRKKNELKRMRNE